jgi:hypothetical protein
LFELPREPRVIEETLRERERQADTAGIGHQGGLLHDVDDLLRERECIHRARVYVEYRHRRRARQAFPTGDEFSTYDRSRILGQAFHAEQYTVSVDVLQRPYWNGEPKKLEEWFRLEKPREGREHRAVCEMWSHEFGWELRLLIDDELHQSQVCRTQDEVLETVDAWKAALHEKGWATVSQAS